MTQTRLSTLTIPRLQALLKATRARYKAHSTCSCCGESYETLYSHLVRWLEVLSILSLVMKKSKPS